ncbi:aromatic ring-hydroxylating oxygenase subunit alpha [Novosphingobium lentum]|uniref:aromatic ring-hydroxylating oxygenase subunit alpha n=1 Tax=Novosphingobium lentum TaxID=145287 RepID=UPI00082C6675|nr:aromatic ring-hydroxylating dioxygenase subunit alpha [Novosphingobium lentum]
MKIDIGTIQQGTSTPVSPTYQELLKADARAVPAWATARGEDFVDVGPVPRSRYYDPAFAQLEMDNVWKKCWQIAARAEEIPEVGDRVEYAVGTMSFIIVRSGPDSFKALWNSCLHRGTKLCTDYGAGEQIRCPFHAWTWNVDGSPKHLPGLWDFPGIKQEKMALPEVPCDTWGGNIFINPDAGCGPLKDALGVLPEHFKDYDYANRWTAVHVRKKVRANWKTTAEAFLEGWHLSETHPQAQAWNGDSSTQYDVWEDEHAQVSRSTTPSAVPSPELGHQADARRAVIETITSVTPPGMELPDFDTIENLDRAFAAEWRRKVLTAMTGVDCADKSDTEMLDAAQYFMFPNFFPWHGEGAPLWYQFMPLGDDPNACIMDVRFLLPMPAGGQRPPAARRIDLDFDETYQAHNVGFGLFDEVFDQDQSNVPRVQQGCQSGSPETKFVNFGLYQESRLHAFHARLARLCGV